MEGNYRLQIKNSANYKDEDFLLAIKENRLDSFLAVLDTEYYLEGHNLINHWFSAVIFHNVFEHGIPDSPGSSELNCVPFNNIGLMTTDSEPTYTETYTWYDGYEAYYDNIGSTGAKGFVAHRVENQQIIKDPDGKESLRMRTRWIFLPSQANSNDIRSVGIFGSRYSDQSTNNQNRYQIGRIRFKDPISGNPIIISKNVNQAFVFEYTVNFVSL